MVDRIRDWVTMRPLAAVLVALVAGVAIAGIVAAAVAVPMINDLTDERDSAEADLAQARTDEEAAQQVADRLVSKRDTIIGHAQDRADQIVGDAQDQLSDLKAQISDAQGELNSTQSKLTSVQSSLQQAEETKAKSTFGDGTWQSGVDYIPGTYSAPGGSGCYWEKLNGPSGGGLNNIIENGGFNKNQIVSVDSPYFHTADCGTWTLNP